MENKMAPIERTTHGQYVAPNIGAFFISKIKTQQIVELIF